MTYYYLSITHFSEANNCLLNQSSDLDPTALTPLLQVLPGQKYSVDTQCAYFLGNESTFCRVRVWVWVTYQNITLKVETVEMKITFCMVGDWAHLLVFVVFV